MDPLQSTAGAEERRLANYLLGRFGAPAYARRARRVEDAYADLLAACRRQRYEWLEPVRWLLGELRDAAGSWMALRPVLADDDQACVLEELAALVNLSGRPPSAPASRWRQRRRLAELCQSLERFNRRWQQFLDRVDLSAVNALRDGYNRFYVLEKECAVRTAVVARQGFRRLEPLTTADLAAVLPPLPVPRGK
jgi:hypothetical protein